jgi:hypothetical protein
MNLDEVVGEISERHRSRMILQLARESVTQASKRRKRSPLPEFHRDNGALRFVRLPARLGVAARAIGIVHPQSVGESCIG